MTRFVRFAMRLFALILVATGTSPEVAQIIVADPYVTACVTLIVTEGWFASKEGWAALQRWRDA